MNNMYQSFSGRVPVRYSGVVMFTVSRSTIFNPRTVELQWAIVSLLSSSKELRSAAAIEGQIRATIMLINTFSYFYCFKNQKYSSRCSTSTEKQTCKQCSDAQSDKNMSES